MMKMRGCLHRPRDADGEASSRERMLATIDAPLDARTRGDKEAVAAFLAPGAGFRIAGDRSLYGPFPAGPAEARPTVAELIDRVRFHSCERIDAIVEDNRAACRWRIDISIGGGPVGTTKCATCGRSTRRAASPTSSSFSTPPCWRGCWAERPKGRGQSARVGAS
jgi:hypothetical protein